MSLRAWYKLSLGYFALLGLFLAVMLQGTYQGWLSDTGAGLWGAFGALLFGALGIFPTVALGTRVRNDLPTWNFVLSYLGLAIVTGLGAWALLGWLTYRARKQLNEGNGNGL